MSNYSQLKNQIVKLQKEAEILLKRERVETIANIKQAIAVYNLSAEDLGLLSATRDSRGRQAIKKSASVASEVKTRGRPTKKSASKSGSGRSKTVKKSVRSDKRRVVAPKFRDNASGSTWTGRGKQPKWLAAALLSGKTLEDFKI